MGTRPNQNNRHRSAALRRREDSSPLTGLLPGSSEDGDGSRPLQELIQWFDDQKARNHIMQKRMELNGLHDWRLDEQGYFSHRQGKFFSIVGIRVTSPFREVRTWSQPILTNVGTGIIGLLVGKRGGTLHALMQAKADAGNRTMVQLAPTVQFTPGNYIDNETLKKPFLFDEFMSPARFALLQESRQSEEGGRFYKEDHVHRVLMLREGDEFSLPEEYRWMSLDQIRFFLHLGETVNFCARSILACLL